MNVTAMSPAPSSAQPAPHPRRWAGLAVLCASLLVVIMDMTILNVALPAISADLLPTSVELLWIVDVYGLAVAGLLVTASGLADRFGRRRILLIGYAIFGVVPMLVLVVDSAPGLVALRALLGVGGALIMPSTMSMIRGLFTDAKERALALGAWVAMAAIGSGLGPIVGGVLVDVFNWHAAFLFNIPVMVVAAVAALVLLPESRGAAVPWDFVGIGSSIVGMVSLMWAIKEIGKHGLGDTSAWVTLAVAVVSLSVFVVRSLRRKVPLLDIRLLRKPQLSAGLIYALVSSIAMAAVILLLAQWMQLVNNYSPIETGIRLLPMAVVAGVLSPLAPRIAAVVGVRNVMVFGLVIGGLGFAALYPGGDALDFRLVVVCQILIGASTSALAVGSALIMSAVPPERTGNAAALEETSFELGAALGVAVLGSLAAAVFRSLLPMDRLAEYGVTADAAGAAQESLAGALTVAEHMGADGAALALHAQSAFTDSLTVVGLAGGVLMLLAAVAVWFMTPAKITLDDVEH
ncbi:MAG TPA: MFS transporter [Candidatus Stackebrandtia excrementipullorum]|nr:MFS transporter [Candidatus Stackebrandtia excrementipullorum]